MNILEIKDKLILTFSTPLREYYKRHIVFWDDPEKEFVDIDEALLEVEAFTQEEMDVYPSDHEGQFI